MTRTATAALLVLLLLLPAAALAAPPITNTATISASNGFTANGDGTATVVTQVTGAAIPTLSLGGLAALALLLAAAALHRAQRRQARRTA